MKKLIVAFLAASLFACLFVSCGEKEGSPVGEWQIASYSKGNTVYNVSDFDVTLNIVKKGGSKYSYTGYSGVNNYFGQIKVNDGTIDMSEKFGSTMMAGPEEDMEFESAYFELIASADSWKTYTSDGKDCLEISSSSAYATVIFEKR